MPATCPTCGRRKGRRACPAVGHLICATCCGTKRRVEIDCPPTCGHLASARSHPPAVVQRRQERGARFLFPLIHDLTGRQYQLFVLVQAVIARHRQAAVPSLEDQDVAEAAAALAATLETESRGIIYEHRPASLPAQRLEFELKAVLRRQRGPAASPDREIATILRRTEHAARRAHAALEGGGTAYLDFVERVLPEMTSAPPDGRQASFTDRASGLLIP